jgi:hypothetical protein
MSFWELRKGDAALGGKDEKSYEAKDLTLSLAEGGEGRKLISQKKVKKIFKGIFRNSLSPPPKKALKKASRTPSGAGNQKVSRGMVLVIEVVREKSRLAKYGINDAESR